MQEHLPCAAVRHEEWVAWSPRSELWMTCAVPVAMLAAAVYALQVGGGDLWLADRLYALQGGDWALKNAFVTETLLHRGGRLLSIVAWVAVVVLAVRAWWLNRPAQQVRVLAYLALAVLLASTAVSVLKQFTGVDCPWALARFGGALEHLGLFDARPAEYPHAACFPAGHASAGYAWVALYFAGRALQSRWRWPGLAIGLGAGALFGFAQQLRGAHFLSHDLATLAVCWAVASVLYVLCFVRAEVRA